MGDGRSPPPYRAFGCLSGLNTSSIACQRSRELAETRYVGNALVTYMVSRVAVETIEEPLASLARCMPTWVYCADLRTELQHGCYPRGRASANWLYASPSRPRARPGVRSAVASPSAARLLCTKLLYKADHHASDFRDTIG